MRLDWLKVGTWFVSAAFCLAVWLLVFTVGFE